MNYYDNKDKGYFTGTRMDLISLLPDNPEQNILEIGAGGGDTLTYIKQNGLAKEVMGFESFTILNSNQDNQLIDKFVFGNIEKSDIPVEDNYYDVIIMGDVLEHLVDTWSAILKTQRKLKKGGKLIVSIPNTREIMTYFKIYLKGSFEYDPAGKILDKTHICFFFAKKIYCIWLQLICLSPSIAVQVLNTAGLRNKEKNSDQ
jgi:2-polyprenyl-3-methyl-5-hydroxy-6-metoxy-1,4-benzoquinol methylase